MFVTRGIAVSLFLNLAVLALANLLKWFFINDIAFCSCKVATGVALGNFNILRTLF
jgi:hypothetical protein